MVRKFILAASVVGVAATSIGMPAPAAAFGFRGGHFAALRGAGALRAGGFRGGRIAAIRGGGALHAGAFRGGRVAGGGACRGGAYRGGGYWGGGYRGYGGAVAAGAAGTAAGLAVGAGAAAPYYAGPAAVYGGLLHYASRRAKPDGQPWNAVGWTRNSFSEIFGNWPRPQDRIEPKPLPDFLIDHWAKICKLPPTKRGAA